MDSTERFGCAAVILFSIAVLLLSACAYPRVGLAPLIASLSPSSAMAGGAGFTLTTTGTGFDASSAVRWNGSVRNTTLQSATVLVAQVPADDIASPGLAKITVVNLEPAGPLISNAVNFPIN